MRRKANPLHDTRELETAQDRLVRLESNYESLRSEMQGIHESVDTIGDRLDQEFQRIREQSRPNYVVWVALAGLLVTMFFGIGAAAYVPVWITTNNINDKAQQALNIAHQNENVNATQETAFREVETQFRGIGKEIQTQIDHGKELSERNDKRIDALERHNLFKAQRISRIEQRLADMGGKEVLPIFQMPTINEQ